MATLVVLAGRMIPTEEILKVSSRYLDWFRFYEFFFVKNPTNCPPCSYRVSFNCPPDTLQRISTCHRTVSHTLSFTQMLSILYKFHFGTAANIFPPLNKTKLQSEFTLSRSLPWTLVLLVVFLSLQRRKMPTIIANFER